MNKYKLSRQTRGPLVSVMIYMGVSAFLFLLALAFVSLFTPLLVEAKVFFLIRTTVFLCSLGGMAFLTFGMFKADWHTYSFEIDSESIVRVWTGCRPRGCPLIGTPKSTLLEAPAGCRTVCRSAQRPCGRH